MDIEKLNNMLEELQNDESCGGSCASCGQSEGCGDAAATPKQARHTFAVLSGKGGTGKSTVTALLANALAKRGVKVGILDADIASPTIHLLYGMTEPADSDESLVFPMTAPNGVKFISMGNVHDKPESPIIWGNKDMAGGAGYFWTDVRWEQPDLILFDMPSGLGDIPLQLYTTIPFSGAIIVSTPDDLADYMAIKSIGLCHMLMITLLGVVENKTRIDFPEQGFSQALGGDAKEHAEKLGLPLVAELPYSVELSVAAEMGRITGVELPELDKLADTIAEMVKAPAAEQDAL